MQNSCGDVIQDILIIFRQLRNFIKIQSNYNSLSEVTVIWSRILKAQQTRSCSAGWEEITGVWIRRKNLPRITQSIDGKSRQSVDWPPSYQHYKIRLRFAEQETGC
jgi:hypothetical protein